MDHYSSQLMEDIVLEGKNSAPVKTFVKPKIKTSTASNGSGTNNPKPPRKLKVELSTLRISEDSEKLLYETLKQVCGEDFKLLDSSEFQNKSSNLGRQYWLERGNLVIKGVMDFSSKDSAPKSQDEIIRQFATSTLESYSFHNSHCVEALSFSNGNVGKALEILFCKYFQVKKIEAIELDNHIEESDILQRQNEEKEALESIYGDMFVEKIKNQIWVIKLKLDYLLNKKVDNKSVKPKPTEKEICRLFLHGKCRFGGKCKFLHQKPQNDRDVKNKKSEDDPYFLLEIRFPEGSKYPYEAPYFYFSKSEYSFCKLKSLRIMKRLYDEALQHCENGTPSIFAITTLLENEFEIKSYLDECKEQFLDKDDKLFPKLKKDSDNNGPSHHVKGVMDKRNKSNISWDQIVKMDDEIRRKFFQKQRNSQYLKMKDQRRKLPAWSMMDKVLDTIHENQVTIISGETGCGKSTQVPQFILDDWILNRTEGNDDHVEIICTQPRRISAIGVAERVAAERDERVGQTVGYQIRLESKMSSNTRLTFCTTGILLQRLSGDPKLSSVTHIIVDEVHERSAESDFLLMLLRELLKNRRDLKIILMSATLKADEFSTYFGIVPVLDIPGRTFPVEQIFLEELFEKINYVFEENSKYSRRIRGDWKQLQIDLETMDIESNALCEPKDHIPDHNLTLPQIVGRYPGYNLPIYKALYLMDPDKINYELLEQTLEWIVDGVHDYPQSGSIVVFLPGFAEILTVKDCLRDSKIFSAKKGRFLIVPLHSSLSSEEQSLVFRKPNDGVRKIVLSTNIAETSVTIDDCVFVIDTGKMKETRFNSNQNMESLETCWVSKANALQRKGRAGRVMPGVCFHLYTSHRFTHQFSAQPIPEILRIPLEPLLLRIEIMHNGGKVDFQKILGQMIESPSRESINAATKRLQDVGAFDSELILTPLGHHLAALPVDVRIGKLILFGAIFCCLDSALTIAACLSHKSPFVSSFERKHELNIKKKEFAVANSDHLTTLKAYKKWLEISYHSPQASYSFANENFLSIRTLQTLADIKYQFLELLISIGFAPIMIKRRQTGVDRILDMTGNDLNANNENYKLLQGLLCAALYPNVVKVFTPEKSFQMQSTGAIPRQPKPEELKFQTKQDGLVNVHPSSINFSVGHFASPYIVFQEKIKTSKVYIKELSMVPMLPLILFSGYGISVEQHDGIFVLSLEDGWIMFRVDSDRVAQLLQYARIELVKLLELKMQDPLLNLLNHQHGKKIIKAIVKIISSN
ncbi:putative ATP-dependent RNA helicase DHX57 [Leptopilina boulardi]|uniref:putative ATP-dependent RNA helicase DHX57 n=1 Tax=Leptopilina boulardi TaxID=63433 RepID=UPI0021F552B3|nr:putative ATP-dependent RNA helicase DHX57 [Leptopilina boulardi]